mmetsp:Transcript_124447/g.229295  ORF Transcript_124447/g.229295 Transcript_124447/m.229295 type:complete len:441 (-) Transcript_124447:65-1387(-)
MTVGPGGEVEETTGVVRTPTTPTEVFEDPDGLLGKRVVIEGTSREDLNGRQGVAISFDSKAGRYGVRVDNGSRVALKPEKLREAAAVEATTAPQGTAAGPPRRPVYGPPQDGSAEIQGQGPTAKLIAKQHFAYGEPIAREAPLLLVPADTMAFIMSTGTEAIREVLRRLGDTSRLAVFLAFLQLPEAQREELLGLGTRAGSKVEEETKKVIGMFLKDFPQLASALDWDQFARVVAIVTDRGDRLPGGERVLHRLSGVACHSDSPNTVIELLGKGGEKELRCLAYGGIAAGEEITASYIKEEQFFLPRKDRLAAVVAARGIASTTADSAAEALFPVLERVRKVPRRRPEGREPEEQEAILRGLLADLARVDMGLPFAMVAKARARTNLASAFEDCGEASLPQAIALYEAAIEETEVVLGAKGRDVVENIGRKVKALSDRLE